MVAKCRTPVVQYYENMDQSTLLPSSPVSWVPRSAAPLRRQVLDELRQSIIAGRLQPGARLVERELIAMMGVSRTVIREALRQLESEGLVAIVPNKGPIVRELTRDEARDLYSIRAVLEGLAARLFVENASELSIGRLERELRSTEQAYADGDSEQILAAKNRFYEILLERSGQRDAFLDAWRVARSYLALASGRNKPSLALGATVKRQLASVALATGGRQRSQFAACGVAVA